MNRLPSLLVIGSQARVTASKEFQDLREELVRNPCLAKLRGEVRELPLLWQRLLDFDPSLTDLPGVKYLDNLARWLDNGEPLLVGNDSPNLYELAITVLLHITQYTSYLHQVGNNAHQAVLNSITAGGVQGLCVGFLSATAIASSRSELDIGSYAAVALKIAVCAGAYVDLDARRSSTPQDFIGVAVRWSQQEPDGHAKLRDLVRSLPGAYISSINDDTSVTVTIAANSLDDLVEGARVQKLWPKLLHIHGRFHSSCHLSAVDRFSRFFENLIFARPQELQAPLRDPLTGELATEGSLARLCLENVLLNVADWYTTVKEAMDGLIGGSHSVAYIGPENCVPASLLRKPNLTVLPLSGEHSLLQGTQDTKDLLMNGHLEHDCTVEMQQPMVEETEPLQDPGHGAKSDELLQYPPHSIAIVGMAGRFPGAASVEKLWDLILEGRSTVEPAPLERLGLPPGEDSNKVKWWGNFLKDPECFDHKFFNKSSREAVAWDPQQRILLEVIYEALESAAYFGPANPAEPRDYGCYIGAVMNNYYDNLSCYPSTAYATIGTSRCYLSGAMSYHFGWTGPSLTIDTACSSSLVAINAACRAINSGECSRAVAGGTNVISSPFDFQNLAAAGFLSPSGQCKPFDADADGYCRGEGVAVVVLKRLADAVQESDNILGVITGSAANQNHNCGAITAPHSGSQVDLYRKVLDAGSSNAEHVSYVEAHGTGTGVGDPVEAQSIRETFGGPARARPLYFGSIKGNIGHTEATAGVAGLIKVLLMMRYKIIAKQASHSRLNPKIPPLETDRLTIARNTTPWSETILTAFVSSYGAAGSNSALLVRQKPNNSRTLQLAPLEIYPIFISAGSLNSLSMYGRELLEWLRKHGEASPRLLGSVAFHLSDRGNHSLSCVLATPISSGSELEHRIEALIENGTGVRAINSPRKSIVLVFGGQETLHIGLSERIYQSSKLFQMHLDSVDALFIQHGKSSLLPSLFQTTPIEDVVVLHAALFAVQYASARSWMDCGLEIRAVVGHSFGQLTALCISGVLSPDDTLKLIVGRASMIQEHWGAERGTMLSVQADRPTVERILASFLSQQDEYVEIACYNGPENHVVVGSSTGITMLQKHIASTPRYQASIRTKRLDVTNGFHSRYTEPLLPLLKNLAATLKWNPARIHLETTDELHSVSQPDSSLVPEHTRRPVFFTQAIERLVARYQQCTWLEVGRGSSVTQLVKQTVGELSHHSILSPQLCSPRHADKSLVDITISLWTEGYSVQYWPFHRMQKLDYDYLSLPPIQFEKTPHWLGFTNTRSNKSDPTKKGTQTSKEKDEARELLTFTRYLSDAETEAEFVINPHDDRFKTMLGGHVMAGESLAPASLFFELVARAALFLQNDVSAETFVPTVDDLSMVSPVGHSVTKQISMILKKQQDASPTWSCSITSQQSDVPGARRTEHVTCKLHLRKRADPQVSRTFERYEALIGSNRYQLLASDPEAEKMQGNHIYRAFNTVVSYSKAFHGIKDVACLRQECVGTVRYNLDRSLPADVQLCDTPMVDSFMQFAGFLVNYFHNPNIDDVFVCGKIEHISLSGVFKPDAGEWLVYSNMSSTERSADVTADVYVTDAQTRKLVFVAHGFHFSKMQRKSLGRLLQAVNQSSTKHGDVPRTEGKEEQEAVDGAAIPASSVSTKGSASKRPEILRILSEVTDVPVDKIRDGTTLDDLGIDSLMGVELLNDLRSALDVTLDLPSFLLLPNIRALVQSFDEKLGLLSVADDAADPELGSESITETVEAKGLDSHGSSGLHSEAGNKPHRTRADSEVPSVVSAGRAFDATRLNYDRHAETTQAVGFWKEAYPLQARLVLAYVAEAFAELGCDLERLSPGEKVPTVVVLPRHKLLLRQLHRVLEDGQLVVFDERSMTYTRTGVDLESESADVIYSEIADIYPQHSSVLYLVRVMGSRMAACLSGDADPMEILFGNPSNRRVQEELYEFWPLLRTPTLVLADFLARAFSSNRNEHGKFRILEVGAGTGGTTRFIVSHLKALGVDFEYFVTDIGASFVNSASKHFAGTEGLRFEVLDIEKPPKPEHLGVFHCILATNCVHATRNVNVTLSNLRQMLRDDGFLALIEITKNMFWLDVVVGLLSGWWLFEDGREHALMNEKDWELRMRSAGFQDVSWSDGTTPESKTVRVIAAFSTKDPTASRPIPEPTAMHEDIDDPSLRLQDVIVQRSTAVVRPPALSTVPTSHSDTYPFISPLAVKEPLPDLSVLITGASKGIGHAIALSFARAGFPRIALLARSDLAAVEASVLQAAEDAHRPVPHILKIQGSISDKDAVAQGMSQVEEAFGGSLDILINNASRLETWRSLADSDVEDWWETWETNLKGTYLVTRAALPLLLRSTNKTVVAVTSGGAIVSLPGASAYQGTKAAQVRFIDMLMAEYGSQGLLAYAVHPCGTKTATTLKMPESMHFLLTETPEVAGDTIVWLTRERRDWLAGRFIYGPSDMQELEAKKDEIVAKDLLKSKLAV